MDAASGHPLTRPVGTPGERADSVLERTEAAMNYVFPPPVATLPVAGGDAVMPIRRVFCVGRN